VLRQKLNSIGIPEFIMLIFCFIDQIWKFLSHACRLFTPLPDPFTTHSVSYFTFALILLMQSLGIFLSLLQTFPRLIIIFI